MTLGVPKGLDKFFWNAEVSAMATLNVDQSVLVPSRAYF